MGRRDGAHAECLLTIFGRAKDLVRNEFGVHEMGVMLTHLFRNYRVSVPHECDMTKLEFLLVQPRSGK
jgi:hypothetical protein